MPNKYFGKIRRSEEILFPLKSTSKNMKSACETTKVWTMCGQTKNGSSNDGGDMGGRSLGKVMNPHSNLKTAQNRHSEKLDMNQNKMPLHGADTDCILHTDTSTTHLLNVLVKIQSQSGRGMPELGIVLSPSDGKETQKISNQQCTNNSVIGNQHSDKNVSDNDSNNNNNNDKKPRAATNKRNNAHQNCRIKSIVKGSPAYYCDNLKEGDVIRRINMVDVSKLTPDAIVAMLRRAIIDSKWTYSPVRLQVARIVITPQTKGSNDTVDDKSTTDKGSDVNLMNLMGIAIKKNSKMVSSKKPNPIRQTLLQRGFCDRLDQALATEGYYDISYHL